MGRNDDHKGCFADKKLQRLTFKRRDRYLSDIFQILDSWYILYNAISQSPCPAIRSRLCRLFLYRHFCSKLLFQSLFGYLAHLLIRFDGGFTKLLFFFAFIAGSRDGAVG